MRSAMAGTYVANVTVFDGRRVGRARGVLVDGERIAWVGAHARAPREARDARPVDGSGKSLTPGLIDCHVHLTFDGSADFQAEARELDATTAALKATANLRRHLANGVTSIRDLGGLGTGRLAEAVDRGVVAGPRVVAAGRALTVTGGHGHNIGVAREVDGPMEIRHAVREEVRGGARAIKVMATGGVLTPGIGSTFTAFTTDELGTAVEEAHRWDCGVAAHAIGAEGILQSIRVGADSVEHCVQATAEAVEEMRDRGTFRSPTIAALLGIAGHPREVPEYAVRKAQALIDDARTAHARCVRGGVRHVCGTDAGTPFNRHGGAPGELVSMVAWGSRPLDALVAGTANGAELLRLPEVGTIEPGKLADLVLYDEDPVQNIEAVLRPAAVWKAGRVVARRGRSTV
jgi:imidazolonepropionase-like amidohydrolase